jgi:TonB family protein
VSFAPTRAAHARIWAVCVALAALVEVGIVVALAPDPEPHYVVQVEAGASRPFFVPTRFERPTEPTVASVASAGPRRTAPAKHTTAVFEPDESAALSALPALAPQQPQKTPEQRPVADEQVLRSGRSRRTTSTARPVDVAGRNPVVSKAPGPATTNATDADIPQVVPLAAHTHHEQPGTTGTEAGNLTDTPLGPDTNPLPTGASGEGLRGPGAAPTYQPGSHGPSRALPTPTEWARTVGVIVQRGLRYPPGAQDDGLEGVLWVRISVDPTGAITAVRLIRSSGDTRLDEAALARAHALGRVPAPPAGTTQLDLPIRFELR